MDRDASLNLSRVHFPVTSLGPGTRVAVWVQGCTIGCAGCISRDTWDREGGATTTVGALADSIAKLIGDDAVDGVTISGGEPFQQAVGVSALIDELRSLLRPDADVLIYSGLTLEAIRRDHADLLAKADAVISDPYVAGRASSDGWRGSTNQRLTLVSDLGRQKESLYQRVHGSLQVSVAGERVWIVGIPKVGDMERLVVAMNGRGVDIGELSWRP